MNDVKFYLDPAEKKMGEATIYLEEALAHIRAGKANVKILDGVKVDAYGSKMALSAVANISVPDARSIMITPWDKSMFRHIEKAIMDSNVGITPENNGEVIRLNIPPLTEERRKQLVKDSKAESEKAKVSIRNARREATGIVQCPTKRHLLNPKNSTGAFSLSPQSLKPQSVIRPYEDFLDYFL